MLKKKKEKKSLYLALSPSRILNLKNLIKSPLILIGASLAAATQLCLSLLLFLLRPPKNESLVPFLMAFFGQINLLSLSLKYLSFEPKGLNQFH
jgi:hypothetical protein